MQSPYGLRDINMAQGDDRIRPGPGADMISVMCDCLATPQGSPGPDSFAVV
jgi:hypothetical protein